MWKFGPHMLQYMLVITVNLSMICIGIGETWASPVLRKLLDETDLVLDRPITMEEAAWIASLPFLGGFVALFSMTLLLDNLGRKLTLLISGVPRVISYVLLTAATRVWMLYVGRFLTGLADGVTAATVSIYSSEIASKDIRGGLGTLLAIFGRIGALVVLSVGPFVGYTTINLIAMAFTVAAVVPLIFLPDSPYFLYKKGKTEEATAVLTFLRGDRTIAENELKELETKNTKNIGIIEIFHSRRYTKSLAIALILTIGSVLSGMYTVNTYLQTVLVSTGSSVAPEMSSVIVGLMQLAACCCTTLMTDRFGRKPIIVISQIGMAVGFGGLGAFFFVTSSADSVDGWLNYLPLISIVVTVLCYYAGMGALMFGIISEVLDGRIRALGQTISQLTSLILLIVNITYFYKLLLAIGEAATYWMFGGISLVMCIFISFWVPETNGKSFAEIQRDLKG